MKTASSPSATAAATGAIVTDGRSTSRIAPVAVPSPEAVPPPDPTTSTEPATVTVTTRTRTLSSGSSTPSASVATRIVCAIVPGAKVTLPDAPPA